jgi:hypothetical protein
MTMSQRTGVWVLVTAAAAGCATTQGSESTEAVHRGPSTQEEREQAVRLVSQLEEDPFSPQAADARRWLTVWLIEIPDITVRICADLFPLADKERPFQAEIMTQSMFAQAASLIQHSDEARNNIEVQWLRGLEASLRLYEKARWLNAQAASADVDRSVVLRNQGQLPAYVHQESAHCAH